MLRERPIHGYEMFQTLIARNEDRIVKVRPGSLYHVVYRLAGEELIRPTAAGRDGNRPEATILEITDVREAGGAPAIYLVALDYLLATTTAKVAWLPEFVGSLQSGSLQWRHAAAPDTIGVSRDEVTI